MSSLATMPSPPKDSSVIRIIFPFIPKAIFTANAYWYDDVFKIWAATLSEEKTLILGTQHGGNYHSVKYHPGEMVELSISDIYYSWGWEDTKYSAEVIPMPANKLCGRKKIGASNKKKGITLGCTTMSRYIYRFENCNTYDSQSYIKYQIEFIANLNKDLRKLLKVRLYRIDRGINIEKQIKDNVDFNIERWNIPFSESLKRCRIRLNF